MRVRSGSAGSLLCMGILSGVLALTPAPAIAAAGRGPVLGPSYHPGGEPLILASDAHGGIWYGGAAPYAVSEESEAESSIWHLSAGGGVTRLQLPTKPVSRFAQYFATGGTAWSGSWPRPTSTPAWSWAGSRPQENSHCRRSLSKRGCGCEGWQSSTRGDVWSTQSGTKGRWRRAGIVRIAPDGQVTVFRRGLLKGAIPCQHRVRRGRNPVVPGRRGPDRARDRQTGKSRSCADRATIGRRGTRVCSDAAAARNGRPTLVHRRIGNHRRDDHRGEAEIYSRRSSYRDRSSGGA